MNKVQKKNTDSMKIGDDDSIKRKHIFLLHSALSCAQDGMIEILIGDPMSNEALLIQSVGPLPE